MSMETTKSDMAGTIGYLPKAVNRNNNKRHDTNVMDIAVSDNNVVFVIKLMNALSFLSLFGSVDLSVCSAQRKTTVNLLTNKDVIATRNTRLKTHNVMAQFTNSVVPGMTSFVVNKTVNMVEEST
eukprot:937304_1